MKVFNKVVAGAVALIVITNPASGAVILDGLDSIFKVIFQYASPVNFAASGIVMVWIGWQMYITRPVTKIPAKGKKNKRDGLTYEV